LGQPSAEPVPSSVMRIVRTPDGEA
jgi:hypothetical protein